MLLPPIKKGTILSLYHMNLREEEGELSGDKEQDSALPQKVDNLCPSDLLPRVLTKSAIVLDLALPAESPKPNMQSSRVKTYPKGPPKPQVIPFPEALERVFMTEWENFQQSKHYNWTIVKLYTLPEPVMKKLKVPSADTPMVAISLAMTLPSEGESGPREGVIKELNQH